MFWNMISRLFDATQFETMRAKLGGVVLDQGQKPLAVHQSNSAPFLLNQAEIFESRHTFDHGGHRACAKVGDFLPCPIVLGMNVFEINQALSNSTKNLVFKDHDLMSLAAPKLFGQDLYNLFQKLRVFGDGA